jgi:hypothetical protein
MVENENEQNLIPPLIEVGSQSVSEKLDEKKLQDLESGDLEQVNQAQDSDDSEEGSSDSSK